MAPMIESADPRSVASKAFNSKCLSCTVIAPMSAMAEKISNTRTVRIRRRVIDTDLTKRRFSLRRVDSPDGAKSQSAARRPQHSVSFANLKHALQLHWNGGPNRNRTNFQKPPSLSKTASGEGKKLT